MQLTQVRTVAFGVVVMVALGGCSGQLGEPCDFEADCEPDLYCETYPSQCGGPGECAERGDATCSKEIAQECGCDGKTYDNGCLRQQRGVPKFGDGICN